MLNKLNLIKLFRLSQKLSNKPVFLFFYFLFCFSVLHAQENLVLNGSFEEYWSCPTGNDLNDGQLEKCKYWWKPTFGTSDFYNRCNTNLVSIPNNFWGNQEAFEGDGYVGFGAASWDANGVVIGNEYLRTELSSPLKPCHLYKFKMYVSLAEVSTHGISNIGAWFDQENVFVPIWTNIVESPQIVYTGIPIIDTVDWTKIEGTFIANGYEKYLTIGYFKDNIFSDTIFIQDFGVGSEALYYTDSISVFELGSVSNEECNFPDLAFPNSLTPNGDYINDFLDVSKYLQFVDEISILNRWGNSVAILNINNPIWDGQNSPDGVYYYIFEYNFDKKKKQTGFIHLIR